MIINDYTPSEDIFRNMLIELINKRKITIEALETISRYTVNHEYWLIF